MASATGIPEENPATQGRGEDEPLLGRAGDASQQDGHGIQFNFVLGTSAIPFHIRHIKIADIPRFRHRYNRPSRHLDCALPTILPNNRAICLTRFQLTATIWASVFIAPLSLFSAHPVRLRSHTKLVGSH